MPVSIRQGVDYKVQEIRLPLGVKVSEFLVRDYWYRRLSREIGQGIRDPEARLQAYMTWSRKNIRPVPAGWPVMDDHILYTIIRGYGVEEQVADVFTTLGSYSGIPSFWGVAWRDDHTRKILSFCRLNGRWTVWDAGKGEALRNPDGSLKSVEQMSREPGMSSLSTFSVPKITRTHKQMPLPRLLFEARRPFLRLAHKEKDFDPEIVFRN